MSSYDERVRDLLDALYDWMRTEDFNEVPNPLQVSTVNCASALERYLPTPEDRSSRNEEGDHVTDAFPYVTAMNNAEDFDHQGIKIPHGATVEDLNLDLRPQALDLNITALPGEQVAIAIIHLFETLWADMTPEQKQVWLDWMIEDQKRWRAFWGLSGTEETP